jgi:hypothetical protein
MTPLQTATPHGATIVMLARTGEPFIKTDTRDIDSDSQMGSSAIRVRTIRGFVASRFRLFLPLVPVYKTLRL